MDIREWKGGLVAGDGKDDEKFLVLVLNVLFTWKIGKKDKGKKGEFFLCMLLTDPLTKPEWVDEDKRSFQEPKHCEIQFKNTLVNVTVKQNVRSVKNTEESQFQAPQKSEVSN